MIDTTGLFDIWSLVSFLGGIAAVWVWQRIKVWWFRERYGVRKKVPKWNPVYIALAIAIAGFFSISVQSSSNSEAVRDLANDTAKCQKEFNSILRSRSSISAENDRESRIQRDALADWLRDLIRPPEDIARQPSNSAAAQQYIYAITTKYYLVINESQQRQIRLDMERAQHPLPDPTCGR